MVFEPCESVTHPPTATLNSVSSEESSCLAVKSYARLLNLLLNWCSVFMKSSSSWREGRLLQCGIKANCIQG